MFHVYTLSVLLAIVMSVVQYDMHGAGLVCVSCIFLVLML